MSPRFFFKCSYLNSAFYGVIDSTGSYEMELRCGVSDYERSIYNGPPDEYERHCAARVGYASRQAGTIPLETVAAFNAWQAEKTRESIERFERLYGPIAPDDDLRRPLQAKGAARWAADGWQLQPIDQVEPAQ